MAEAKKEKQKHEEAVKEKPKNEKAVLEADGCGNRTVEEASEADGFGDMTVEEAFEQLSEIVNQMSSSEVGLEESLRLYKQGVQLLSHCGNHLDQIEKEMITLTEEGEMPDEY